MGGAQTAHPPAIRQGQQCPGARDTVAGIKIADQGSQEIHSQTWSLGERKKIPQTSGNRTQKPGARRLVGRPRGQAGEGTDRHISLMFLLLVVILSLFPSRGKQEC